MSEIPTIKTGTVINIDGHELTIIDINTSETVDGRSVVIRGMDEESARGMQIQRIKQEHISEETMDAVKRIMGMITGGKFPGMPDFPEGEGK